MFEVEKDCFYSTSVFGFRYVENATTGFTPIPKKLSRSNCFNQMKNEFHNASDSFKKLNAHLFECAGNGTRPEQKESAHGSPQQQRERVAGDKQSRVKGMDGAMHGQFRVTIILRMSDNRRRDIDGGAATLLDCLIAARRRMAIHSRAGNQSRKMQQG